jgi:hypothetical protein
MRWGRCARPLRASRSLTRRNAQVRAQLGSMMASICGMLDRVLVFSGDEGIMEPLCS